MNLFIISAIYARLCAVRYSYQIINSPLLSGAQLYYNITNNYKFKERRVVIIS